MQASEGQIDSEVTEQDVNAIMADPLCSFLIDNDRLKASDLRRAVSYQEQHGGDLLTLLVRLGLVSERDVAEAEGLAEGCETDAAEGSFFFTPVST